MATTFAERQQDDNWLKMLEPSAGRNILQQLLAHNAPQIIVLDAKHDGAAAMTDNIALLSERPFPTSAEPPQVLPRERAELFEELQQLPAGVRKFALEEALQREVAAVLGMPDGLPDKMAGFTELGMDSLMVVELKNRLQRSLGTTLSATAGFNYPSIHQMAGYLMDEKLDFTDNEAIPEIAVPDAAPTLEPVPELKELDGLSEEDLVQKLAARFEAVGL